MSHVSTLGHRCGSWRRAAGVLAAATVLVAVVTAPAPASASSKGPWHITLTMAFDRQHTVHGVFLGCQHAKDVNHTTFHAKLTMTIGAAQGTFPTFGKARETYGYHATEDVTCPGGDPWERIVGTSSTKNHRSQVDWYDDKQQHRGTHRILETSENGPYPDPEEVDVYTESTGHHERDKSRDNEASFRADLGKVADLHRGMHETVDAAVQANTYTPGGDSTGYLHPVRAKLTVAK